MLEWIAWEQHDGAFPSLQELCLSKCPKLMDALLGELPSLKKLQIDGCDQLVAPFPRARAIVDIDLKHENRTVMLYPYYGLRLSKVNHGSLISLDQILGDIQRMGASVSDLKRVDICYSDLGSGYQGIGSFSSLEGVLKHFKCLDSLVIDNCPKLVSFPKCELASPTLTKLRLVDQVNLKSLPQQMKSALPCLVELVLRSCPELESFPEGGLPSKLESLAISKCKKLMAGQKKWNLHALPSLSSLTVGGGEIESFPEAFLLPRTLTTLEIWGLAGLKSLDEKGLRHLASLQRLVIGHCSSLEKLVLPGEEEERLLLPQISHKS